MYREAFERAKATGDSAQMATLDFAIGASTLLRFCLTSATLSSDGEACNPRAR
jgi:hypothetical protein